MQSYRELAQTTVTAEQRQVEFYKKSTGYFEQLWYYLVASGMIWLFPVLSDGFGNIVGRVRPPSLQRNGDVRVRSSRVEDERGGLGPVAWGPVANAPFPIHRVAGGSCPPPAPTERSMRIYRTTALRQLVHSTARACNSAYGRRSFGFSNGVRSLMW